MTTFTSPIALKATVTVKLGDVVIRWCVVSAIKWEEERVRYDVVLPNGTKLYDLDSPLIEPIEVQAGKIADGELK